MFIIHIINSIIILTITAILTRSLVKWNGDEECNLSSANSSLQLFSRGAESLSSSSWPLCIHSFIHAINLSVYLGAATCVALFFICQALLPLPRFGFRPWLHFSDNRKRSTCLEYNTDSLDKPFLHLKMVMNVLKNFFVQSLLYSLHFLDYHLPEASFTQVFRGLNISFQSGAQSQKKQKLSGQQDFCCKNFPDKARKSRQLSNLRQMPVKGVLARS